MVLPNPTITVFYEGTNPSLYDKLDGPSLNTPLQQLIANDLYLSTNLDIALSEPYSGIVYKPTVLYTEGAVVYYQGFFHKRNATVSAVPVLPSDPTYWSRAYDIETPDNTVFVNSVDDLPAAVLGVRTLANNTVYIYTKSISTSDTIRFGTNSKIQGFNRFAAFHAYTGTGDAFTYAGSGSPSIAELGMSATTGTVFNFTGSTAETFVVTNSYVLSCQNVGSMNNIRTTIFRSFSVVASTVGGLIFTGNCQEFAMSDSVWSGFTTGKMIDFGAVNTFLRIQITQGNRLNVGAGVIGVSGLVSSGNFAATGFGLMRGVIFQGLGTYLENITKTSLLWSLSDNYGIPDSSKLADGYITGSALNTTPLAASTPLKVNFGSAFLANNQNQFSIDTSGRITFNGEGTVDFHVFAVLFAKITGGSVKRYNFYFARGTGGGAAIVLPYTIGAREYDGTNPGSLTLATIITLYKTQWVELWVEQITSGMQAINVDTCSLSLTHI